MITSRRERTDTTVAIERYVRAVGETLTSQERGPLLVVGNGDGWEPLSSGLEMFYCGRGWADASDRSRLVQGVRVSVTNTERWAETRAEVSGVCRVR